MATFQQSNPEQPAETVAFPFYVRGAWHCCRYSESSVSRQSLRVVHTALAEHYQSSATWSLPDNESP